MKTKLIFLSFVFFLLIVSKAHATGQAGDKLKYDGRDYEVLSNPLEALYIRDKSKRPKFMVIPNGMSSGNWRGYVAQWEISDKKLYLTAVYSWLCNPSIKTENQCRPVTLNDIIGDKYDGKPVLASWFSGELRIPDGKRLLSVHMGYGSVYERDILFKVDAGNVATPVTVDNTQQSLPSANERAMQELEKLKIWESGEQKSVSTFPGFGANAGDPIVAEKGWSRVTRGATREAVEAVLGNGEGEERHKTLKGVYFREYPESGMQVSYLHLTNTVEAIFFYNNAPKYERHKTPPLKTDKNIDWKSTADDVLKVYGEPVGDYKSDDNGRSWRRIEFKGIDFRFEQNKMVRISVIP